MAKDKAEKTKAPKGESKSKEPKQSQEALPIVPARLHEKFEKEVIPILMKRFNYGNINQVPKLEKIALNIGVGGAASDPKLLEAAVRDLEAVVGQKVSVTKSRKSISNFKLRENQAIGLQIALLDEACA